MEGPPHTVNTVCTISVSWQFHILFWLVYSRSLTLIHVLFWLLSTVRKSCGWFLVLCAGNHHDGGVFDSVGMCQSRCTMHRVEWWSLAVYCYLGLSHLIILVWWSVTQSEIDALFHYFKPSGVELTFTGCFKKKTWFLTKGIKLNKYNLLTPTFGRIVFNWLFKGRDVAECAKKKDHFLLFISNGGNLHKKPNRRPWKV